MAESKPEVVEERHAAGIFKIYAHDGSVHQFLIGDLLAFQHFRTRYNIKEGRVISQDGTIYCGEILPARK